MSYGESKGIPLGSIATVVLGAAALVLQVLLFIGLYETLAK